MSLNAGASEWTPSFGSGSSSEQPSTAAAAASLPYYEDGAASTPANPSAAGFPNVDGSQLDPAMLATLLQHAGNIGGLDLGALLGALPQLPGASFGAAGGMPGLPGSSQYNMAMASGPFGAAGIARQERDNDAENLDEIELAMQQAEIEAFLDSQGVFDPDERNRMMLELMQELREEGMSSGAGLLPVPGVDGGDDDDDGFVGAYSGANADAADYYSSYTGPSSSSAAPSLSRGPSEGGTVYYQQQQQQKADPAALASAQAAVSAKMNQYSAGYAQNLMSFASAGNSAPVSAPTTVSIGSNSAGSTTRIVGAQDNLFGAFIPSGTNPGAAAKPAQPAPAPAPAPAAAAPAPAPAKPATTSNLSSTSVSFVPAGGDMWAAFGGPTKR